MRSISVRAMYQSVLLTSVTTIIKLGQSSISTRLNVIYQAEQPILLLFLFLKYHKLLNNIAHKQRAFVLSFKSSKCGVCDAGMRSLKKKSSRFAFNRRIKLSSSCGNISGGVHKDEALWFCMYLTLDKYLPCN